MNQELSRLSAQELWESFRKGNRWAFQQIYQLYIKDLFYYGKKVTPNRELVEDAIHDLFLELWQSREKLSTTDSIKFYLFRALRYKINHTLQRPPYQYHGNIEDSEAHHHVEFPIEASLIRIEKEQFQERMLRECLDTLSPRQQQAIHLRFYEHFSNDEIARIMEINYHSACKLIYSALKSLKEVVRIFSVPLIMSFIG